MTYTRLCHALSVIANLRGVFAVGLVAFGPVASAQQSASSHDPVGQGTISATESGFTTHLPGALPHRNRPYEGIPPLSLPHPTEDVVVIWSHGTKDGGVYEACNEEGNAPPPSIYALGQSGIHIYYLCSKARFVPDRGAEGTFVRLRMLEVAATLRAFRDLGVPAANIFLAGHSAGAWVSLMMAREYGAQFNGVIAFAPAFARPRADVIRFPNWRNVARPAQIAEMISARRLHALVFAYDNDIYNRPKELRFLPKAFPETVELVGYGCDPDDDHMSFLKDCRAEDTTLRIRAFIRERLAQGF